jgi:transcription antitermination factor NusA-like protein
MMVPGHKVGLIIGKGGEAIKALQEQTGAKITVIQASFFYQAPAQALLELLFLLWTAVVLMPNRILIY